MMNDCKRVKSATSRCRLPVTPIILFLLLVFSFYLRKPNIDLHLPYLYNIDDAPALDWILRIIKSESYHPQQFIKPAFPYYFLFPAVGVGFLKAVERGEVKEFKEIKSENIYGDQNHEYTVSHPTVAKYVRLWCIFVSLSLIVVLFYLGKALGQESVGLLTAFFLSLSSAHLVFSPLMWFVSDMMASICVCLTVLFAVIYLGSQSPLIIALSSLMSGLALSSKYNSLPILLVPLLVWTSSFFRQKHNKTKIAWPAGIVLIILLSFLSFVLASPYSLLSYRQFLDGAAWQVWAYKHAWPDMVLTSTDQLIYYFKWIGNSGVGWGIFLAALVGMLTGVIQAKYRLAALLLGIYPVLFVLYMCQQQINYVQNMLPVLPFLCLFAAMFVDSVAAKTAVLLERRYAWQNCYSISFLSIGLIIAIPSVFPLRAVYEYTKLEQQLRDSRDEVEKWVMHSTQPHELIAISGELLFPHSLRNLPRAKQIRAKEIKTVEDYLPFWQEGYSYLILPSSVSLGKFTPLKHFPGVKEPQRIIRNPDVEIIALNNETAETTFLSLLRKREQIDVASNLTQLPLEKSLSRAGKYLNLPFTDKEGFESGWGEFENGAFTIKNENKSGYRWISSRYARLVFTNAHACDVGEGKLEIITFSPWPQQKLDIYLDGKSLSSLNIDREWSSSSIPLSQETMKSFVTGKTKHQFEFVIAQTGKLSLASISADTRQLGVALHRLSIVADKECYDGK